MTEVCRVFSNLIKEAKIIAISSIIKKSKEKRVLSIHQLVDGIAEKKTEPCLLESPLLAMIGVEIKNKDYSIMVFRKQVCYVPVKTELCFDQIICDDCWLTRQEQAELFGNLFAMRKSNVPILTRDLALILAEQTSHHTLWINPKYIANLSKEGIQLFDLPEYHLAVRCTKHKLEKYGRLAYSGQAMIKRDLDPDNLYQTSNGYAEFLHIPRTYFNNAVLQNLERQSFYLQRGKFIKEIAKLPRFDFARNA